MLDGFDSLIHSPKRLRIMAILSSSDSVDFAFLRESLDVKDADLSKQMAALESAGYVSVSKPRRGRGGATWYRLTRKGREAFDDHVAALRAAIEAPPIPDERPT